MKMVEWWEGKITGFEERTVEEKRPREGRLERNWEAPLDVGFESDGCEDEEEEEPSIALEEPPNKCLRKIVEEWVQIGSWGPFKVFVTSRSYFPHI